MTVRPRTRTLAALIGSVAAAVTLAMLTSVAQAGDDETDGGPALTVPSATARTTADGGTRWVPYHQPDVHLPAGDSCVFAVKGSVTRDHEFYRNVSFYSDGTPRTQLFKGPLYIRWTNKSTGRSVLRNQSGRAILEYAVGGSFSSLIARTGHFSTGMPAGSTPGKGLYYVGGRWSSVQINDDDTRTLVLGPRGGAENLCETLAR